MPSFVIVESAGRTGETTAVLCDPNAVTGYPDRGTDVPIRLQLISDRMLSVDGEPRQIISAVGINGSTTYLINGTTRGLRNRDRRIALARASALLQQLAATLKPLQAGSEE